MPPTIEALPFPLPRLTPDLRPSVAWPTVVLSFIFAAVTAWSTFQAITSGDIVDLRASNGTGRAFSLRIAPGFWRVPAFWVFFLLRALSCYVSFTPMHDASHGSVAQRCSPLSLLNDVVGTVSATCTAAPFHLFSRIHHEHHRYTNADVDADSGYGDPDLLTAGGAHNRVLKRVPWGLRHVVLLFFCAALPLQYLAHIVKHDLMRGRLDAWTIVRDLTLYVMLILFPLLSAATTTEYTALFWLWAAPNFVAYGFLGLFFDYYPHRGHDSTKPVLATSLVTLFDVNKKLTRKPDGTIASDVKLTRKLLFEKGRIGWLSLPLLQQNNHVLHHLMPQVPFYLYSKALYETSLFDDLADHGMRAFGILPVFLF